MSWIQPDARILIHSMQTQSRCLYLLQSCSETLFNGLWLFREHVNKHYCTGFSGSETTCSGAQQCATSSLSPNFHSKVAADWREHRWEDKTEILSTGMGYLWLSNHFCLSAGQAQLLYCSHTIFWLMHKRNKLVLCYGRKKPKKTLKCQNLIRLIPDYLVIRGGAEGEQ